MVIYLTNENKWFLAPDLGLTSDRTLAHVYTREEAERQLTGDLARKYAVLESFAPSAEGQASRWRWTKKSLVKAFRDEYVAVDKDGNLKHQGRKQSRWLRSAPTPPR